MSSELDKQNDGPENFSEPDAIAAHEEGRDSEVAAVHDLYCPDCGHPYSYHRPGKDAPYYEEGCSQAWVVSSLSSLNDDGSPLRRYDTFHRRCHCGESMRHKRERLRAAMYAAKTVFKDAERAYTEELHAQREALRDFSGGIERGRE